MPLREAPLVHLRQEHSIKVLTDEDNDVGISARISRFSKLKVAA